MSDIIRKSTTSSIVEKSVKDDSYTFVISTENEDLSRDIVVQSGLKAVSPRIPAMLDHAAEIMKSVGVWENIRTVGKKTLADLKLFPASIKHAPADLVRNLLDSGCQLAASIGFKADDYELRDPKKGWDGGLLYKSTTLLETSIVVVPCNSECLSLMKSKGYSDSDIKMVLSSQIPVRTNAALLKARSLLG